MVLPLLLRPQPMKRRSSTTFLHGWGIVVQPYFLLLALWLIATSSLLVVGVGVVEGFSSLSSSSTPPSSRQQQQQRPSSSSSSSSSSCHQQRRGRHDTASSSSSCQKRPRAAAAAAAAASNNKMRTTSLHASRIVGQEMPLMDLLQMGAKEFENNMIQPLPSRQYPDDAMRTLFLYAMPLIHVPPVHQQAIINDATNTRSTTGGIEHPQEEVAGCFGHLAYKPSTNNNNNNNNNSNNNNNNEPSLSSSLVGAIGCVAQIFPQKTLSYGSPLVVLDDSLADSGLQDDEPIKKAAAAAVLCRGWYRFIVRKVIQTIPYPVAIVDELVDDEYDEYDDVEVRDGVDKTTIATRVKIYNDFGDDDGDHDDEDDDDDADDDDDEYADLTPDQLEKRLVQGMRDYVQQQLDVTNREMTPLELSILQDSGGSVGGDAAIVSAQRQAVEEMAAVLDVFLHYLVDESPILAPTDRYYMLAFMAAEMIKMDNDTRRKILVLTNSVQRLRLVLAAVDDQVGMARARLVANSITAQSDEEEKDLKVGRPQLPAWALQIRKGMRIEYYWNEEYEWCVCEVVQDPVLHQQNDDGSELVLTVLFEDDNDRTRQLPFRADEKARWRPAQTQ
jgi:hypothetical protein